MSNENTPTIAQQIDAAVERQRAYRNEQAKHYYALCDLRDEVYRQVQPLEDELAKVNEQIEELRKKQFDLALAIEKGWGPNWLTLKKEIKEIAGALGKIPPRESLV
jgi:uncharacterized coiled-coil DUF342 family protein